MTAKKKINIITIVVPVYNEQKTICLVLERISKADTLGLKKQLIVINDGSTDKTESEIQKFIRKNQKLDLKLINHPKNQGKGAALRSGFSAATGDLLIIQDADLEYNPIYYPKLIKPIVDNRAEVVYGSRFKGNHLALFGDQPTPLPIHYIYNTFLSLLTSFVFQTKITDMETGYKAISSRVYPLLNITSDRFNCEPEITAKILKQGFKILEIPIQIKPRGYNDGKKINWKDGIMAIFPIIKYRFRQ